MNVKLKFPSFQLDSTWQGLNRFYLNKQANFGMESNINLYHIGKQAKSVTHI